VEDYAVRVLGIGQNAPAAERGRSIAFRSVHNNLKAAVTASTVIAKLTQGPQSIAPAITTIAKRGQNDLPKANPVCDRNVCDRRLMLRCFPLRFALRCKVLATEKNCRRPGRESAHQRHFGDLVRRGRGRHRAFQSRDSGRWCGRSARRCLACGAHFRVRTERKSTARGRREAGLRSSPDKRGGLNGSMQHEA